jgi:signal transduction histidine kinase
MLDQIQAPRYPDALRTVSSAQVHDLKNRLTVIKGIVQLLGRQVRRSELDRDRLEERVNSLQDEVIRIEILINDIGYRDDGPGAQTRRAHHLPRYADD